MDADPRTYLFHGVRIGCSSTPDVAAALRARLGQFPHGDHGGSDLAFDYQSVELGGKQLVQPLRGSTRAIYNSDIGEVLYSDAADEIYITCSGCIRVGCDPRRGRTSISIADSASDHLWLVTHPLFTIPLIESLKRRGRYSVHAAGVAMGGRAVLFPGSSGSGKSTLALAMLREGFAFLGDDMLFLDRSADGLRALAFPEAIDLTDDTIRLFPDMKDVLDQAKPDGWPKRQVRAEQRYGAEVAWDCKPVALVFPRVAHADHSVIEPMGRDEALLELVPNILLTEPESSQAHLDALGALVEMCECYRLETGPDFGEVAARVRAMLEVSG
jgi:hypothetical protein